MARLQGYEPVLVSGFGLVVDLNGTGSSEVPARLRVRLINEMARKGLGSAMHNTRELTPARVLDSSNSAVVVVEGLIPPGATKGTRFDLLISALPQTQTTSLAGGMLWSADLAIDGTSLDFHKPLAVGRGPSYLSPADGTLSEREKYDHDRQAVVVAGGVVSKDMPLKLVLNQPNWTRSRLIAERINERFRAGTSDRSQTAVAKTDLFVELNIPARFAADTDQFLGLLQHLYVQRGYNFEPEQARRLAHTLVTDPTLAERVALAWQALGKTVLPVIRPYYEHPNLSVRVAALEAGVRLKDTSTLEHLTHLSGLDDPDLRRHAAALIARHPSRISAIDAIRRLLNDSDEGVRLATYEALARTNDVLLLQRVVMGQSAREDFLLDIVDSQRPMVYLSQTKRPRVVVFNSYVGFKLPMVASFWDGRLMVKALNAEGPMQVYYRRPEATEGQTYEIAPTVANLVFLLAHRPNKINPTQGLGLSFNHVVDVLYQLEKEGRLQAPLDIEQSRLVAMLSEAKQEMNAPMRPELSEYGDVTPTAGIDTSTMGKPGEDSDRMNDDRSHLNQLPTP